MEAIVDAHQQVVYTSNGQRPMPATSMNGQIYRYRQAAPTRRKRVHAKSVDDPGGDIPSLGGPPHDAEAIKGTLLETDFQNPM
jgi:hypothetical protein